MNEDVVLQISSGAVHIYEPDLDGLVQKVISTGALKVSMQPVPSDAFIIAVPTPINAALEHVLWPRLGTLMPSPSTPSRMPEGVLKNARRKQRAMAPAAPAPAFRQVPGLAK
jgi:UDP-glucose/GDP-mannose dehydrogenase family, NAD binding domain